MHLCSLHVTSLGLDDFVMSTKIRERCITLKHVCTLYIVQLEEFYSDPYFHLLLYVFLFLLIIKNEIRNGHTISHKGFLVFVAKGVPLVGPEKLYKPKKGVQTCSVLKQIFI